jgi:hypothetical protein
MVVQVLSAHLGFPKMAEKVSRKMKKVGQIEQHTP